MPTHQTFTGFRMPMRYSSYRRYTYLSGLLLATAFLYYLFLGPTWPANENGLPTSSELEALKRTIEGLRGYELFYNDTVPDDLIDLSHSDGDHIHYAPISFDNTAKDNELVERAPWDPPEYKKSREKGQALLKYLNDPSCAPPTHFTDSKQLTSWGWSHVKKATNSAVGAILGTLSDALNEEQLSLTSPPNEYWSWTHNTKTYHEEKNPNGEGTTNVAYYPTGANYANIFNVQQGAIIAVNNFGPSYTTKRSANAFPAGAPLPSLQNWSDVIFLTWQSLCSPGTAGFQKCMQGLKFVIRQNVVNDVTNNIIGMALKKANVKGGTLPPWPGYTFTLPKRTVPGVSSTSPFEAVLGTPNCLGVAWLLIQHAEQFGKKRITGITVWDKDYEPNKKNRALQASILVTIANA